jgi:hypothetical protein
MNKFIQRIRYPPFEYSHMDPVHVPIVEVIINSETIIDTEFKIGNDKSWFAEFKKCDENFEDSDITIIEDKITTETLPFLMKTRNGWYISPDPLHLLSRKIITPTVILLILSILVHATEPVLLELDIISQSFAGSYRLGPLDYPKLLLFSFPIFLMPIIIRMVANMRDIRKQNNYVNNPIMPPEIEIKNNENQIVVKIISMPKDVHINGARLQVGMAVPERKSVLKALNMNENQQPSPGMSTKLPEKRISTGDDLGTGVGEAMPMTLTHGRILMLDSLRVLDSGNWVKNIKIGTEITLNGPDYFWPGSIYSSLITIHWELIIDATRTDGTRLKWIRPVTMSTNKSNLIIPVMPVRSGRIEVADY